MSDTIKKICNLCEDEFEDICDGKSICESCEENLELLNNSTDK